MFEAVIMLCLSGAGDQCRPVLLPGFEATTQDACEAALDVAQPEIGALFPELAAKGPATCTDTGPALDFEQVAPGVFAHRGAIEEPDSANGGDVSNVGFVIGDASVAVIDTGSARWQGEAIWRAIRQRTDLPVSHLILTHMHPDHVLGASVFAEAGAQVVGHRALDRALSDRRANYLESLSALVGPARFIGSDMVATDMAVEAGQSLDIDLGGRVLTVQAWPMAHTGTDVTALDRTSGILFAGDLVFDEHTPALDGSLRGWQAVLDDLTAMPVTAVVPGHGGPVLDWPEGAAPLRHYLDVLAQDTRAAIDAGTRLGDATAEIAASEADNWQLFDAYNPRNATVAFTELEWE